MKNLFADVPESLKDELIETILQASNFRIERIVSQGHCSPEGFWYDQSENEWVILLKGSAGIRFEEKEELIVLHPGDHIQIPRHLKHRVEWTDNAHETVWLAVHYK
jgi:cupin 2 domain-containing protein